MEVESFLSGEPGPLVTNVRSTHYGKMSPGERVVFEDGAVVTCAKSFLRILLMKEIDTIVAGCSLWGV